jgi:hypothetical protein
MNRVLSTVLGIVFLVSLFSMMTVRQYYTRNMPQVPQQESGRTIAIEVNYGKTVYVTVREKRNLHLVYIVAALSIAGTLVFVVLRATKSAAT